MTPRTRQPTLDIGAHGIPSKGLGDGVLFGGILAVEAALLYFGLLGESLAMAVGLAVGFLFFLTAYRWPDLSTGLVFAAAPLSFQVSLPAGSFIAIPTEPMMLLALAGRAARALAGGPAPIQRVPLLAPLAVYGAAVLLSCLFSEYPSLSLKAWSVMACYAAFGYSAFAGISRRTEHRWVRLAAIVATVVGAYGVLTVLAEGVSSRAGYGIGRPFFPEHGTYSAYLSIFAPLLLLEALDRRGWPRAGYGAAFLIVLTAVILSFTRAAWLSLSLVLPATLLIWAIRKGSLRALAVPGAWAAAIILIVVGTGLGDRLSRHALTVIDTENVSNLERVNRWMAGWQMTRAHPWTGVGYDSFGASYPAYRRKVILTEETYVRMGAHSEPLRALSETGLLGLLAGAWLVWAVCANGLRAFRRSTNPSRSRLALGVTAGLGTYFVHGWLNAYPGSDKVGLVIWMAIGAVAALSKPENPQTG